MTRDDIRMVENTIGVFTNQFTNKVMREINNSFNNEAPNSTDSVKISGTSISIDKSQFYNYLCLLNQVIFIYTSEKPTQNYLHYFCCTTYTEQNPH